MKRAAAWVTGLAVLAAVLAGGAAVYFFARYPSIPPAENVRIEPTPERLARGKYLFHHVAVCADCHSTRDWTKYAAPIEPGSLGRGGEPFTPEVVPGIPGSFYARNITPAAIGDWTDGEIMRAITEGVNKNGEALFPVMPYPEYGTVDRDDIEAIVAYVRTLTPIPNHVPERSFAFPMQFIVRTIPQPARFTTRPPASDTVAYGRYLTTMAGCGECHTPIDDRGQRIADRAFAGGMEFRLPEGGIVRTANLTPDADSGIGTWSEQQFVDKFKAFEGAPEQTLATAAERQQNTVMPWTQYAGMTREDLAAIYAFLRTQRPVLNRVEKFGVSAVASR